MGFEPMASIEISLAYTSLFGHDDHCLCFDHEKLGAGYCNLDK